MSITHRFAAATPILLAILIAPSGGLSAEEVTEETEAKIGQVLVNFIKGGRQDSPPTEAMMKLFREQGQNTIGPSWGYRTEHESKQDRKVIQVYFSITVLPADHQRTRAQAAAWAKAKYGDDEESGAEIAFQESMKGGVRRTRVVYRLEAAGYRLFMHVTRPGDETAEQAVEKTMAGWRGFYQYAVDEGLFGERLYIEVAESEAETEGLLEDGGVIRLDLASNKSARVPIAVWAESAVVEEDEPYTLHLKFKQGKGRSGISLVDAKGRTLRDGDGDGWLEVEVIGGEKGRLELRFDKLAAKKGTDDVSVLDQFALGRIAMRRSDDGSVTSHKDFAAQRRDWFPVVQRFQLLGRAWSPESPTGQPIPQEIPERERVSFNEYVDQMGALREVYETRILPLASPRQKIGADEEVCMGWRIDPVGSLNWYLAVNSPQKAQLPVVPRNVPLSVVLDVKIVGAEKSDNVAFDDEDGLGGGFDDEQINERQHESEIRRLIYVDDGRISLVANKIAEVANNESADAFEKDLPQWLRLAPGGPAAGKDESKRSRVIWEYRSGAPKLDDYLPLAARYESPIGRNEAPFLTRNAGVYELRFTARLYHSEEGLDAAKEIDVAVRYGVAPDTFKVRRLMWDSRGLVPKK